MMSQLKCFSGLLTSGKSHIGLVVFVFVFVPGILTSQALTFVVFLGVDISAIFLGWVLDPLAAVASSDRF